MRILFLDNDEDMRWVVALVLQTLGKHKVQTAASIAEAMSLNAKYEFDMILSDYQLDGETGIDFLKKLKKTENKFCKPFVIITTPVRKKELEGEGGVFEIIDKPISTEKIVSQINLVYEKWISQSVKSGR